MRNRRTDLALEARELWQESAEERTQLEGVEGVEIRAGGYASDYRSHQVLTREEALLSDVLAGQTSEDS